MSQQILSPNELAGVWERLKRADETILSLESEMTAFLKATPEVGLSGGRQVTIKQWADAHGKRAIPRRFSVLAGEVVHHLRSCLDHIVWSLSSEVYRQEHETAIGFPILTALPADKRTRNSYEKRVAGVSSAVARRIIEELQPYNSPKPADNSLAIINKLDRIDKHHDLVLAVATFDARLTVPFTMFNPVVIRPSYGRDEAVANESAQKVELQVSRQVALLEFGERKNRAVVPALKELLKATEHVIERFAGEA